MLKDIDHYSKEELYDYLAQVMQAYQEPGAAMMNGEKLSEEDQQGIGDLLSMARLLQQDVFTIIKKFREINVNLEREVRSRTEALAQNEANLSA